MATIRNLFLRLKSKCDRVRMIHVDHIWEVYAQIVSLQVFQIISKIQIRKVGDERQIVCYFTE